MKAIVGLHAPRMWYWRKSTPIFVFSVSFTSISVRTPKLSALRAALAMSSALSYGTASRTLRGFVSGIASSFGCTRHLGCPVRPTLGPATACPLRSF